MAKAKLAIKVIEVEKASALPVMDAGAAAAVSTLEHHPGFRYLVSMLKFQGAALKAALVSQKHKSLEDVFFLQSGCNWCDWLQIQVAKATELTSKAVEPREMRPAEIESFERLRSQIDVIGVNQAADNS